MGAISFGGWGSWGCLAGPPEGRQRVVGRGVVTRSAGEGGCPAGMVGRIRVNAGPEGPMVEVVGKMGGRDGPVARVPAPYNYAVVGLGLRYCGGRRGGLLRSICTHSASEKRAIGGKRARKRRGPVAAKPPVGEKKVGSVIFMAKREGPGERAERGAARAERAGSGPSGAARALCLFLGGLGRRGGTTSVSVRGSIYQPTL